MVPDGLDDSHDRRNSERSRHGPVSGVCSPHLRAALAHVREVLISPFMRRSTLYLS